MEKVKIVDHGKCFGNDHWYLFYCPHCKSSVQRLKKDTKDKCSNCGNEFEWPEIST